MNENMQIIISKIEEYDKIILFRHIRPDADAVGSTKGLQRIIRLSYPEKDVRVIHEDKSEILTFLGEEDAPVSPDFYKDALAIVIDTGTEERISNKSYALCREILKIDHHIEEKPYGNAAWVEPKRSSASEMIVSFYEAFRDRLKIDAEAATYLYTGIVADSGRFRFTSVSGETMRLAGLLLDIGIDTERIFTNLYVKPAHTFRFQSAVYKKMKITKNGVAYLHITKRMMRRFGLSSEQAGEAVNYMDSIKGSLIWMVLIDAENKTRVRLRSRYAEVHAVATKYHGGGHACACGATVYSKKEMRALIADADACLGEYKKTHEGWL